MTLTQCWNLKTVDFFDFNKIIKPEFFLNSYLKSYEPPHHFTPSRAMIWKAMSHHVILLLCERWYEKRQKKLKSDVFREITSHLFRKAVSHHTILLLHERWYKKRRATTSFFFCVSDDLKSDEPITVFEKRTFLKIYTAFWAMKTSKTERWPM